MIETRNRRSQKAEETKRHIFQVALRLLDERNFEEIKVRDIVTAAQVSIGTFYNYYHTKLDVFYETYQMADEYFAQTVAPQLTQPDVRDRILLFFDEYAKYSSEITDLSLTKVLYNSDNTCFDRAKDYGIRQVLEAQVQYGLDTQALCSDVCASEIANFLLVATRGLVYNWCTHDGSYPIRPAMARFVSRLLRAFQP